MTSNFDDEPLDDELDDGGDEQTMPCPSCGRQIYDDAVSCPHCGHYLSDADALAVRKPWWIIVGALLAMYAIYRWILG